MSSFAVGEETPRTPGSYFHGVKITSEGSTETELLDEWQLFGLAGGWSTNTISCRRDALTKLARDCGTPLHEVSALQLATWLGRYSTAWTRQTYFAHARSFFGWLQRSGHRADDPTTSIPRPSKPRGAPRPVSTQQLMDALDGAGWHPFAFIVLGAYSGLRVHEIAKIKGEDLDLAAMTLRVVGKGQYAACIPMHPRIGDLARHYPRRGYWFPSPAGGHVSGGWVSTCIRRAFAHAGHQVVAHQLRHWFATELLRGGANLRTTQECMRHASIASTALYTQVLDAERTSAVLALP
jgi:integrase/recombinase XerD